MFLFLRTFVIRFIYHAVNQNDHVALHGFRFSTDWDHYHVLHFGQHESHRQHNRGSGYHFEPRYEVFHQDCNGFTKLALIVILTLFTTHNLNKEYHTALIKNAQISLHWSQLIPILKKVDCYSRTLELTKETKT